MFLFYEGKFNFLVDRRNKFSNMSVKFFTDWLIDFLYRTSWHFFVQFLWYWVWGYIINLASKFTVIVYYDWYVNNFRSNIVYNKWHLYYYYWLLPISILWDVFNDFDTPMRGECCQDIVNLFINTCICVTCIYNK